MLTPGVTLTCDWRSRPGWRELFAGSGDPIERLRELGIGYAEFGFWNRRSTGMWDSRDEAGLVLKEATALIERGLRVNLHPYVHQDHRGPGYPLDDAPVREHLELALDLAAGIAGLQRHPVTVVFHAADNPREDATPPRPELLARTRSYLRAADALVRQKGADVRVVCENPPPNPRRIRIGETPDEMLAAVAGTQLGLCWDLGHYLMCARVNGTPEVPPDAFLGLVRHVHLHAVENGVDHAVPTKENAYIAECIARLRGQRRDMTVTLEYDYSGRGDGSGGVIENVRRGIEAVLA